MKKRNFINYDVFGDRISSFARKAGRVSTRPVLLLYYVMRSRETPKKDKLLIFSALSYLVFPIDILDAKRQPIIGWFDEIASIPKGVSISRWRRKWTLYLTAGFLNTLLMN